MSKDISIEYAHIYTNNKIGDEQKKSLEILNSIKDEKKDKNLSLVVMIDDYSFPDPSFNYDNFSKYLKTAGFVPDVMIRESELISLCDETIKLIDDNKLKNEISNYIKNKKYPCSLFVATWYLLRLGHIKNTVFGKDFISKSLINILPKSFKPFEDKALEIIKLTRFKDAVINIENRYFEGRVIS